MSLQSLFIGMSGLNAYSRSLRVISNNLANMNTVGFKSGTLQFGDLFYQGGGMENRGSVGTGVGTSSTLINFVAGDSERSDSALDMAIDGEGYFVTRSGDQTLFSKDGRTRFDADNFLVDLAGNRVQGLNDAGELVDISLAGLDSNRPKATSAVTFKGNLASDAFAGAEKTIEGVRIIDAAGTVHLVKLVLTKGATVPGEWAVAATDKNGPIELGAATLLVAGGTFTDGRNRIVFSYAPGGVDPFEVTLDFSAGVTATAGDPAPVPTPPDPETTPTSTLAYSANDGHIAGTLKASALGFDADGSMTLNYSNGEVVKGPRLALARFLDSAAALQVEDGRFKADGAEYVRFGFANSAGFGAVSGNKVEKSNVQLEDQFSNLIVAQRGYQAASHVVTVADELIKSLLDMRRA
jgi:flagellar hook protein FlgE